VTQKKHMFTLILGLRKVFLQFAYDCILICVHNVVGVGTVIKALEACLVELVGVSLRAQPLVWISRLGRAMHFEVISNLRLPCARYAPLNLHLVVRTALSGV